MLVFLQIISALSCDLLDLPTGIEYFSPSYEVNHKIEVSGQFYSPQSPLEWEFEVYEDSWLRLTLEPKYFSIHATLSTPSKQIYKSILSSNIGQISTKLVKGSYSLQLDPDAFEEVDNENLGCSQPYIYFNLGLLPLGSIIIPNSEKWLDFGFPDIPDLTESLKYSGLYIDYDEIPLNTKDLSGLLRTYNFSLEIPNAEQKLSGITGTWKISFGLSNV
jgi:hypothetical protein